MTASDRSSPEGPTAPGGGRKFRFGDFVFDADTGELRRVRALDGEGSGGEVTRLAPQPAKLLRLLLERAGRLLSREEIRDALWPDTHVDFESSLHFCVRQVRAALGDDADTGRYVETLPRRGYRLAVPVDVLPAPQRRLREAATPPPGERARSGGLQLGVWLISVPIALLAVVVVLAVLAQSRGGEGVSEDGSDATAVSHPAGSEETEALRLAIVPFAVGLESSRLESRADRLAAALTVAFTRLYPPGAVTSSDSEPEVHVLGPLSTAPFRELPFPRLAALREELDVELVLNARVVADESDNGEPVEGLLVELIRTDDGAHLWAKLYSADADWAAVEGEIVDATRGVVDARLAERRAARGE